MTGAGPRSARSPPALQPAGAASPVPDGNLLHAGSSSGQRLGTWPGEASGGRRQGSPRGVLAQGVREAGEHGHSPRAVAAPGGDEMGSDEGTADAGHVPVLLGRVL